MIEVGIEADPALRPEPAAGRKVLFSAMKNEAPFLLEWVAYHRVIGFDEIFVAYNDCRDGSAELLEALDGIGWVTSIPNPVKPYQVPQAVAAERLLERAQLSEGDWALWLDADEFLNIHTPGHHLSDLLDALGSASGILVNWRIFGDGHGEFAGRMLAEPFVQAAFPHRDLNLLVKTLFRYGPHVEKLDIHRPVLRKDCDFGKLSFLSGSGKELTSRARHMRAWSSGNTAMARVLPGEAGWALAQINHYAVRDRTHFKLKQLRGRGYRSRNKGNSRHTDEYWVAHNLNDELDASILRHAEKVEAEVARALAAPKVADAMELVRDRMVAAETMLRSEQADIMSRSGSDFVLTLPEAEAEFLRRMYADVTTILEYGSGGSTVLAAELGKPVVSVESDKAWADRLSAHLAGITDKAAVHHVDIGPTKDWGRPRDSSGAARYHLYALSVWDREDLGEPDLVLIDGRFRAACLAAVLLRAKRPTTVLFDDYATRPYYHGVEKLARKEEMVGRMARFTVTPGPIPPEMLTQVIGWFSDPR